MRTITVECANCGEKIVVEKGKNFCYCSVCGTELAVSGKESRIIRVDPKINEARKRELEIMYERHKQLCEKADKKIEFNKLWLLRSCLAFGICLVLFIVIPSVFGTLSNAPKIIALVPILGVVSLITLITFSVRYSNAKFEREELDKVQIALDKPVVIKSSNYRDDEEDDENDSSSGSGTKIASAVISSALLSRGIRKGLKDIGKEFTKDK